MRVLFVLSYSTMTVSNSRRSSAVSPSFRRRGIKYSRLNNSTRNNGISPPAGRCLITQSPSRSRRVHCNLDGYCLTRYLITRRFIQNQICAKLLTVPLLLDGYSLGASNSRQIFFSTPCFFLQICRYFGSMVGQKGIKKPRKADK